MKIEGPQQQVNLTRINRARSSGASDKAAFSKELCESSETEESAYTTDALPLAGIDTLLGLQEVDDVLVNTGRAKRRALNILDRLDDLRLQILEGRISPERLASLAQFANSRRATVTDPKLLEVLDEIDLRAQVELAKLTPGQS